MLFIIGAPIFFVGLTSMVWGLWKSRSFKKPGEGPFSSRLSRAGSWLVFIGGVLLSIYWWGD